MVKIEIDSDKNVRMDMNSEEALQILKGIFGWKTELPAPKKSAIVVVKKRRYKKRTKNDGRTAYLKFLGKRASELVSGDIEINQARSMAAKEWKNRNNPTNQTAQDLVQSATG